VPLLGAAGSPHRRLCIWDFFPDHHRQIGRIPGGVPYLAARYVEQRLLRHFDTIFCTLPGNADYLRGNFRLTAEQQVRIAPIWCEGTLRPPVDRAEIRRKYDLPPEAPIAVFGGQLVAGRGFDQMFAAADNAIEAGSPLLFVFVGEGPFAAEVRKRSLSQSNIRLIPAMPRDAYLDLLDACDVGMAATVPGVTSFSIPSKTLDYLRSGLPVIAAVEARSDFVAILEKYGVGTGVPFGESWAFRQQAERLATDPAVKAKIREAARQCLDEVFDLRHAVANILDAVGHVRCA
jgi:glycosyltransferase involved in cell wall biosynthesis